MTIISDSDKKLFRLAMKGVKPIKLKPGGHIKPSPKKTTTIQNIKTRHKADNYTSSTLPTKLSNNDYYDSSEYTIKSNDILEFSRPGLQLRVLKKLRQGQFQMGAELDLHGKTINIARDSLRLFLNQCQKRKVKCARIIHGKGLSAGDKIPILKNQVDTWLRQSPAVLAFHSALPHDGGTGAVYVLFKILNLP